MIIYIMWR